MFCNVTDYWAHRDLTVPTQCVSPHSFSQSERDGRINIPAASVLLATWKRHLDYAREVWRNVHRHRLSRSPASPPTADALWSWHIIIVSIIYFFFTSAFSQGRQDIPQSPPHFVLLVQTLHTWLVIVFLLVDKNSNTFHILKKPQECWYSLAAFVLLTATVVILCFRVGKLHC